MTETESISDRYLRRAAGFAATIGAVPEGGWQGQSPCEDWKAIDVVKHVVASQAIFTGLIDRPLESSVDVDDDPARAFAEAASQTQVLLDDPAVASTEFVGHMGRNTYEKAVDQFASFDLVVHRWDLAQAAGIEVELDPIDVDAVHQMIAGLSEEMLTAYRSPGVFGPELTPPEGADAQTRMLAFLGRRAW